MIQNIIKGEKIPSWSGWASFESELGFEFQDFLRNNRLRSHKAIFSAAWATIKEESFLDISRSKTSQNNSDVIARGLRLVIDNKKDSPPYSMASRTSGKEVWGFNDSILNTFTTNPSWLS
ncbi:TPA: hypothetical protein DEP94_00060 [Candidatus Nomurabacteria bacterium]|nr:hypothetical protein [Candidatus Nomurabacteria bacterium]